MKRCAVGGQAVLEGVMMRNPAGGVALAVRKNDGSIITEYTEQPTKAKKGTFLGFPIIRGVVAFIESLVNGMRVTMHSAELYGEDLQEEEPSKFEKWLADKLGKSAMDIAMAIAVVLAVLLAIGLFFFLPTFLTQLIPWKDAARTIWKSLTEGFIRLAIFLLYLVSISCMKDIRRLFMYHGAEHKVIACYEHEAELTPESAMRFTRLHPRCGTNYLFLVMAVSILFFAALPYSENFFLRFATRLIFLPLVAGLSYEVLKLAAASDGIIARIVRAPGLGLQYLTTREPELEMLEVALAAFHLAMNPETANKTENKEKEPAITEPAASEAPAESVASEPET
ncbi:MAG: DUF1385 domain-containing protein [Candidatus Aphodomorpha sp.]